MTHSVFIFRRDLRITDNTGLNKCSDDSDYVIPVFILTPEQIVNNKYKSSNSIQFMMESIKELGENIDTSGGNLTILFGDIISELELLRKKIKFGAIYVNEDYTPYSVARDNLIEKWCVNKGIFFSSSSDILLIDDINSVKAQNGNYYKVYTQFYKNAVNGKVKPISKNKVVNFTKSYGLSFSKVSTEMLENNFFEINPYISQKGGRKEGLNKLKHISEKPRDDLSSETTGMSAHNKFGTISIREFYYAIKKNLKGAAAIELTKQLYWRDFYYYVCHHYPDMFKHINIKSTHNITWSDNKKWLNAWKNGMTGFPVVDAAMRQLNETGFMHNRGRLIVGMFLVKDLLINWSEGEKYFGQKLVDVDRCQNLGNWNWVSSFGMDSTPFLRIFNPWTQAEKFDKDCKYIKKWIPELKNVPNKQIFKWYDADYPDIDYPKPIIDHDVQRLKFRQMYMKK